MKFKKLFISAILLYGCHGLSDRKMNKHPSFSQFEICYTNGWDKFFCFFVDSSRRYLITDKQSLVLYGNLPDSLFWEINDIATRLSPLAREKPFNCSDCPIIAAQAIRGNDTIRYVQEGSFDREFQIIAAKINDFRKYGNHQIKQGSEHISMADSMIPKPVKVEDTKFRPPAY